MNFKNEHIWVIGSSSGIGHALAEELAAQGATLALSARREEELVELNEALGGAHEVCPLDVSDTKAVEATAKHLQQSWPRIDRVIFMAAIYKPLEVVEVTPDFAKQLVEVNLLGGIYVSHAVLPVLEAQEQGGQLVLCGSVAGYTGLPSGQPYSATKAAIINYAESLYAEASDKLDIKLINPGFVRTRITDKNQFKMPFRIEPDEAAKAIAKGLKAGAFEIHFPKAFTYGVKFLGVLPYWLKLWITRKVGGAL
jgi:short-subunit dehydrogenase